MQTYTSSKVYTVIHLILCTVMFGAMCLMLHFLFTPRVNIHDKLLLNLMVGVILIPLLLFLMYTLLETVNAKLEIAEDRIWFSGLFTTRELHFREIRGFRVDRHNIYIEPISKDKKRLKVPLQLGKVDKLLDWLKNSYKDLDALEKEEEYQNILNREEYGRTIEERKYKLGKANELVITLNILGVFLAVLIIPVKIEKVTVLLAMVAPVIFIIILRIYNGLIRLVVSNNSPYPSVFYAFAAVIFALILKSLKYRILDPNDVWQTAIIVGVLMIALLMVGNKEFSRINATSLIAIVIVTIAAFIYGYGSVVLVNCMYDHSEGQQYQTAVVGKRITRGRSTGYHIVLSPWGKQHEEKDILISYAMYNQLDIDDTINVYEYAGRMNIPWYSVPDSSKISDK